MNNWQTVVIYLWVGLMALVVIIGAVLIGVSVL